MRKLVMALVVGIICQTVQAETCPRVADIKHKLAKEWKAYDSDDGTPLSAKRELAFVKNIEQFILAEWSGSSKKGAIHCYYRDKTGSNLEAYLSKENFIPENHNNYWYNVSGLRQCAAGMEKCMFGSLALNGQKLAKK